MKGFHRDFRTTLPPVQPHEDQGLQPERTTMAWSRTVLAFITAAAVCLRWVSHHGMFVLVLFTVAVGVGAVIYLTQRVRYTRSSAGIAAEHVTADVLGILSIAAATVVLGALGIYVVLVFV